MARQNTFRVVSLSRRPSDRVHPPTTTTTTVTGRALSMDDDEAPKQRNASKGRERAGAAARQLFKKSCRAISLGSTSTRNGGSAAGSGHPRHAPLILAVAAASIATTLS